jgi:hypothetical protein
LENVHLVFCSPDPLQVVDVGREGDPAGGVHVDVALITDVLLVDRVGQNALAVELPPQDRVEVLGEGLAETGQVLAGTVAEQQQLPLMRLAALNKDILIPMFTDSKAIATYLYGT